MVRDHLNDLNLLRVSIDDTSKDAIGRDEDGPSEVPPKESDWMKKESGPYDDASDLYVLSE